MAMLEVKNLEVYYGVICALKGISFEVNEGEIVSLIGANGAGKTTMMQSVVGLIPKKSGSVIFDGQDITKTPCHKIVQLGMTQVPEGRRIFQELSVYENLMMGAYTVKDQQKFKAELDKIYDLFPRLAERRNQIAGTLSGGEQQMLAMSRALMINPKLLMLDEPAAGMNPHETQELMDIIRLIRERFDVTILLIEHDMKFVSGLCDELTVLNFGTTLAQGETKAALQDPEVIKAYIGG